MTRSGKAVFAKLTSPYYPALTALFVGVMLISNIAATKGVVLFDDWLQFDFGPLHVNGLVTDGAFFLFPLSYVIGDVISEVYGFRAMRRTIASGFAVILLASLCFWIAIELPAAEFYDGQDAFSSVLGTVPQIVAAGLAGYLVGELLNSFVLVKMKERAGEKRLWARLIGSTVVGEFFDTLVFCSIAATAIGISTWSDFINYVIIGFVWKTLVEVAIMPLTYAVVRHLKRAEPSYREALDDVAQVTPKVP
ncbi:queuosine precursor transporter [Gordonia sp. (in: high G+C Gram-positive bacteria)]|uniref:queuosine precursor transporter n=1 Tax=Gordonia sp. (in: high G+C Gram-positive bacteria) TaxID=84139 RepID=UPI0016A96F31|nr:queuosine precursor transporter [Gordonia sp. (in: high G+C Gram-positive bacteria)]NLG48324.1 queuosine precursor transporter [Gordonia sp. (in: high G+C Gram-positive bacteria)]